MTASCVCVCVCVGVGELEWVIEGEQLLSYLML